MTDTQKDEIDKLGMVLMRELEKELGIADGDPLNHELVVPVICALASVAGHVIGMCKPRVQGDLFRLHTQVTIDTLDEVANEEPETI